MNFDLDEQQVLLKNMVERFVLDRYDLEKRRHYLGEALGFSAENWAMLAELGLLALPFPADVDGLDGGPVDLITVTEALGHGLVVEPFLDSVVLAGGLLTRGGTDTQKAEWIGQIIAGAARPALAHSEAKARFNLAHVSTTARHDGGNVVLNGAKTHVLAGASADLLIVSARESGATGDRDGIAFYLVPGDAAGVTRRSYRIADGTQAAEITLDNVTVSADARLSGGLDALEAAIDQTHLAACGEMLGIMGLLMETTLDYLRTRKQFGVTIGSFQAIQHRMVACYIGQEQARSLVYGAALAEPGPAQRRAIAGAKAYVTEAALRIGHESVQFHGGMGVSDELIVSHAHKRILVLSKLLGDGQTALQAYQRAA